MSAVISGFAESLGRVLSFVFFVALARYGGREIFGVVRAALSAGQIGAGLGVPYLTSLSRLAGLSSDPDAPESSVRNRLDEGLTGWFISSLVGAGIAAFAYGWAEGVGPSVFLGTVGFSCNYLGVLLPKSYQMPRTLLAISLWGNAAQLIVLLALFAVTPRWVTPGVVIVVYSSAFILPVLLARRLRPLLRVSRVTLGDVWRSARRNAREYGSFLAQHISHTLVINLDLLVLTHTASSSAVGGYAAVKTVMVVVLLPATALFHLLIPASMRRLRHHPDPGDRQVKWTAITGVVMAAAITALWSPSLLSLVYGSRFNGLGRSLFLAAIGAGAYGLALVEGAQWIALERTGLFSALVTLSALAQGAALLSFPSLSTPDGAALTWAWANGMLLSVILLLKFTGLRPTLRPSEAPP